MKYQELQDEIKAAMKARDKNRLSILRQVHGEIKNIEEKLPTQMWMQCLSVLSNKQKRRLTVQ